MARPVYRESPENVRKLKKLLRIASAEYTGGFNSYEMGLYNYVHAQFTQLEYETILLYYLRQKAVVDIATYQCRNISTVSRNINRATSKALSVIQLAEHISPIKFDD